MNESGIDESNIRETRPIVQDSNTDLALALASMDHLADAIDKDLKTVEEEVNLGAALLTESYIQELKEFCASIYNRINAEFNFLQIN